MAVMLRVVFDSCPPLSNLNLINALFEVGEEKRSETLNQVN